MSHIRDAWSHPHILQCGSHSLTGPRKFVGSLTSEMANESGISLVELNEPTITESDKVISNVSYCVSFNWNNRIYPYSGKE